MTVSDAQIPQQQEPLPRPAGELGKRVISAVVLGVAAIGTAWIGGIVFLLVWFAAAVATWWEWSGVIKAEPRSVLVGVGVVALSCMAIALALDAPAISFVCAVIGAGVATAAVQDRRPWAGAGVVYAALILIPAVMLREDPRFGLVAIFWLFAVVWGQDTGAYFVGRFLGGPKLAPTISPSKTWSGAAGGMIAGIAAGLAMLHFAGIAIHPMHVVISVVVIASAMLGDLLESWIKRRFGVKDAGTLIPGHGGVMDRLDGFAIAAAVALAIGLVRAGTDNPAAGLFQW
jgi:phosphatidate cytidylyltransferase